ncbi:hypothetical protein D3C76_1200730 [compost metagenome]
MQITICGKQSRNRYSITRIILLRKPKKTTWVRVDQDGYQIFCFALINGLLDVIPWPRKKVLSANRTFSVRNKDQPFAEELHAWAWCPAAQNDCGRLQAIAREQMFPGGSVH